MVNLHRLFTFLSEKILDKWIIRIVIYKFVYELLVFWSFRNIPDHF